MRMPGALMLVLGCLLILGGCNGAKQSEKEKQTNGFMRIVNAIPDSPTLSTTATFDKLSVGGGSVGFGQATALAALPGPLQVSVTYFDPTSQTTVALITVSGVAVPIGHEVTVLIKGTMDAPRTQIIDIPESALGANQAQVSFLNASRAGNLSFYLTDFAASLTGATPAATLDNDTASTSSNITASSTLRIRVTPAGSTTLIDDTASFAIAAGARFMFIVFDDFGPDPTAVGLLGVDTSSIIIFPNTAAKAGVRVLNAIPDQVSVTASLTDTTANVPIGTTSAIPVNTFSALNLVKPTTVALHTVAASDAALTFDSAAFTLPVNSLNTIVVAGTSINPANVAAAILTSDRRPIKNQARLDFVNAARVSSTTVDFYAVDLTRKLDDAATTAIVAGTGFLASGSAIGAPRAYDLYATSPGAKTVLAGPLRVTTQGGKSYIVVLGEAASGGPPLSLTVIDDTNAVPLP